MKPYVGEPACKSTGPKVPIPTAASSPLPAYGAKKSIAVLMVSSGPVVEKRFSASKFSGSLPTTQTNLVPPDLIPPNNCMARLFNTSFIFPNRQQQDDYPPVDVK